MFDSVFPGFVWFIIGFDQVILITRDILISTLYCTFPKKLLHVKKNQTNQVSICLILACNEKSFIIWPCLTRTGNYQFQEFDWLKYILKAV